MLVCSTGFVRACVLSVPEAGSRWESECSLARFGVADVKSCDALRVLCVLRSEDWFERRMRWRVGLPRNSLMQPSESRNCFVSCFGVTRADY